MDGKKLIREKEKLLDVAINGQKIAAKKSKGHPFFFRTETDHIRIEGTLASGMARQWEFDLPSAEVKSADAKKVVFKISGVASRVTVDGGLLRYKGNEATWMLPSGKKPFAKTFVLELSASAKPGRLYNVRLTPGAEEAPKRELASESRLRIGFSPADFRLSQISVFQKGGGSTFSGHLAWAPYFYFSPHLGAGAELGMSYFKSSTDATNFPIFDVEASVGWFGGTIGLEARAGAQAWGNYGGTKPVVGGTLNYLFSRTGVIDRLFLAYSYFLSQTDPAHQVRVGLGVSL